MGFFNNVYLDTASNSINKTDAAVMQWWQSFWGLPENIWTFLGMIASIVTLVAISATFLSIRHQNQRFAFETLSHIIEKGADEKTRKDRKTLFTNKDKVSKWMKGESPFDDPNLEELYEACTHLAMIYTSASFLLSSNKKIYKQFIVLHANAISRVYVIMKPLVEKWDSKRKDGYKDFQIIGEDSMANEKMNKS